MSSVTGKRRRAHTLSSAFGIACLLVASTTRFAQAQSPAPASSPEAPETVDPPSGEPPTPAQARAGEGPHSDATPDESTPPNDALQRSKEAYAAAVVAFTERRFAEAVELLERADQLTPSPAFSFNIALAYQELHNDARALEHFRAYLRRAPDSEDRATADTAIRRLERALESRGVQQVTVLSTPAGAVVSIDGTRLGLTPWSGEIAPGFHQLTLELRGYRDETRNFDLPRDRAIDVPVTLVQESVAQMPVDARGTPGDGPTRGVPSDAVSRCSGVACIRPLTWTLSGGALATLGGAGVFYAIASSAKSEAAGERVQLEASKSADNAILAERWALGLTLGGAALSVAAGVLIAVDLGRHDGSGPVTLGCNTTGCRADWQYRF